MQLKILAEAYWYPGITGHLCHLERCSPVSQHFRVGNPPSIEEGDLVEHVLEREESLGRRLFQILLSLDLVDHCLRTRGIYLRVSLVDWDPADESLCHP